MKVPYSWLKEYVDFDLTPEELGAKFVKSGFEVEGIEYLGRDVDNVRICRITKIEKHPNADRLNVCSITLGDTETVIITSATNVFEGAVVPVALDGATLPGGNRIFNSPFRGVMSFGMFCGGSEIGVDDSVIKGAEVNGILILPPDAPIGADIRDYLGLNEAILDISVTSNRPDCQSIVGLAREVATLLGRPFKQPNLSYRTVEGKSSDRIKKVEVGAPDLCTNYYGAVVTDVVIAESPKWMRDRLRYVGIRSINTLVDITNYVLTEIGQPMHAFDLRYIHDGVIKVRRAEDGEKLVTLDNKEFELKSDHLVIADGQGAIGLAGIMGGLNSEVKSDTKDIAFEAARFARGNVRRSSRELGQRSASSARFERGVDVGTTIMGLNRALALVDELGCGKILGGKVAFEAETVKERVIEVSIARVNALLGIVVPTEEMVRILGSLDIRTAVDGDTLRCTVPLFRDDIENYADVAEEIIRIYGYDHIESTLPHVESQKHCNPAAEATKRLKTTLVGLGCCETLTYSFIDPASYDRLGLAADDSRRQSIRLCNPIGEEMSVMRTTMAHNVLTVASLNLNRKNFDFRTFEVSRVFLPKSLPLVENPTEETHLTLCVAGDGESFFTLKGILDEVAAVFGVKFGVKEAEQPFLHPGQSSDVLVRGKSIGWFGLVHPNIAVNYEIERPVYFAELNLDALTSIEPKPIKFAPLPKYQEIERDIALTVKDEVKAGDMLKAIGRECGSKLESAAVFDVYKGQQIEEGCKSVAFKLTFRAADRTLTAEEVDAVMEKLSASLAKRFDAKLRQ